MRAVLILVTVIATTSWASASPAPPAWPALRYLGFASDFGPGDEQERIALRQAVCYAVDKDTVAKAVAGMLPPAQASKVRPAVGIQNPELEGYNPDLKGYPYNPQLARERLKKSGWTSEFSELVFLVGGPTPPAVHRTFYSAVEDSLKRTLLSDGAQRPMIGIKPVANSDSLLRDIRKDTVPAYIHRWLGLPGTPGYPSFALMIAERYKSADPELKRLVDANDGRGTEAYLLDKALVCPGIWEPQQ
jgi:ABC-type transport system substrate-binding protein